MICTFSQCIFLANKCVICCKFAIVAEVKVLKSIRIPATFKLKWILNFLRYFNNRYIKMFYTIDIEWFLFLYLCKFRYILLFLSFLLQMKKEGKWYPHTCPDHYNIRRNHYCLERNRKMRHRHTTWNSCTQLDL